VADQRSLLADARRLLEAGQPQAAEPHLRAILAAAPQSADAGHLLGLALHQTGRLAEGLELLRRSVALAPSEPLYRRNLGLVLTEANRLAEAEAVLRELVARWPADATGHGLLAVALQRGGRLAESLPLCERAVALAPTDDVALNNLGAALLASGAREAALAALERAAALNPRNPMPWLNIGNAARGAGALEDARAAYARSLAIAPGLSIAWHNLGMAAVEAGAPVDALGAFRRAIAAAPNEPAHWQAFADAVPEALGAGAQVSEEELAACLERDDVDPAALAGPAFTVLRAKPAFATLLAHGGPSAVSAGTLRALNDRLFLGLIERLLVPEARFEAFATRLRRDLIGAASVAGLGAEWLAIVAALALQCFGNDYAFTETDAERELVRALGDRLAHSSDRLALALFACYRPLASLPGLGEIGTAQTPRAFARLIERALAEPRAERALEASLPALTPIRDAVSRTVRAMYEEHPYPKWRVPPSMAGAFPAAQKLRALFPWLEAAATALRAPPSILIAGCGTGRHAVLAARLDPAARVLAVDLSRASLAYGARRARELGIENVEFAQADLLDIGAIGRTFEIIDCAGVLHHLADPIAGWRALLAVLAPHGFMRVALYSATARQAVVAARQLIAGRGYAPDIAGIRAARQAIIGLPEQAPAREVLHSLDFWSGAGCRDLLFHVQEHRFTLREIEEALAGLALEFLGFEFAGEAPLRAYRAEFPDDPAARSLANWAAFEARHTGLFAAMYQFWVRPRRG